jgi:hypothetical protein
LPIQPSKSSEEILYLFAIDPDDFPLAYPVISHSQQDNNQLQQLLHNHPDQYEISVLQVTQLPSTMGKLLLPQNCVNHYSNGITPNCNILVKTIPFNLHLEEHDK